MKLSLEQALDIVKSPKNESFISLAKKQEDRLIMHCEPVQDKRSAPAVSDFLKWVQSFLPSDKYQRFEQLLTFPLETVDSTETIFDELSKFFDAADKYTRFEFRNSTYEDDFLWYIENVLNDEMFWRVQGFNALKTGINSFLIVDAPRFQATRWPEPYYYFLSLKAVRDVEISERGSKVEYIAFWQDDGSIIVLDELAYRRFVKPEHEDWRLAEDGEVFHSRYQQRILPNGSIEYGELIEGIGYTPACPFYRSSIIGSKGINKRGPLTNVLSKLDWLLFWKTSKKYLDLYGSWPIIVTYKEKCEYKDENGNPCMDGYVNYDLPDPTVANGYKRCQKECPSCAKRGVIGPGSFWTVDPPQDSTDVDLLKNPVTIVETSNDKLEYGVKETQRLEDEIFLNTVGYMNSNPTKEAINEKQVKSQYESRQVILNRIREQFDECRQFALSTVAKIRYGSLFSRASVFGGQEYFLQSAEDIALQYGEAKKVGLPMSEISRIRQTYSRTKFKNNPSEYQRSFILSQLEPYPDCSINELKNLGLASSDPESFYLKLDFSNYIARFEREQMNVVEFGSEIAFSQKISIINAKLLDYVRERLASAKDASARFVPGPNAVASAQSAV